VAGVTSKAEAVLFHVTPLGQVYGGKAFAVGAGAERANERLAALMRHNKVIVMEENETCATAEAAVEEGCRHGDQDHYKALEVALEALLAAHLTSKTSKLALGVKSKMERAVSYLDTESPGKSTASSAAEPAPAQDQTTTSRSSEEHSSAASSENTYGQLDSEEDAINVECFEEFRDTLRAMLVAAETGDLRVVCCQPRTPDSSSISLESSLRAPSSSGSQPHSRVLSRAATASAMRKIVRSRGWWGLI